MRIIQYLFLNTNQYEEKLTCTLLLFTLCSVLLFYACRKDFLPDNETDNELYHPGIKLDIAQAQKYYAKLIEEYGDVVKETGTKTRSGKSNRKHVAFDEGYASETPELSFVEVPLTYDSNNITLISEDPLTGKNKDNDDVLEYIFDRLVIYKDKNTGNIDQCIVTYIPDKEYLQGPHQPKHLNRVTQLDDNFRGFLVYKRWDGSPMFAVKIRNGRMISRSPIQFKNKKSNSISCVTYYYATATRVCAGMPEVCGPWTYSYNQVGSPDCFSYGGGSESGAESGTESGGGTESGTESGSESGTESSGGSDGGGGTTGTTTPPMPAPPPPVTDPCAGKVVVKTRAENTVIASQTSSLRTKITASATQPIPNEWGTEQNLQSLTIGSGFVNTTTRESSSQTSFTPQFTWNSTSGYTIGACHTHPRGSGPSPADVFWPLSQLDKPELNAIPTHKDYFKNNWTLTVVTADYTYVVTIRDWNGLAVRHSNYKADPTAFNADYAALALAYGETNEDANLGEATISALLLQLGNSINTYRAPAANTNFVPMAITNDSDFPTVTEKTCP